MAKKSNLNPDILAHFPKEEVFVKRVWEWMQQAEHRQVPVVTPFLTPDRMDIACKVIGNRFETVSNGFYVDAEARKLAILPPYADGEEVDFGICQIVTQSGSRFLSLTHRDVLGALMQLGIEREQFGDIAVGTDQIGIAVNRIQAPYIMANLTKIHRLPVSWEICEEPVKVHKEFEEHDCIVSSLRLDTLVAELAHVSRGKAKDMIASGLVKVNHYNIENADRLCHNKDIISIRGYGRFWIEEIKGTTKKGNVAVVIRQYK